MTLDISCTCTVAAICSIAPIHTLPPTFTDATTAWQLRGEAKSYKKSGTDGGGRACRWSSIFIWTCRRTSAAPCTVAAICSIAPIDTLPPVFTDATTLIGRYERHYPSKSLKKLFNIIFIFVCLWTWFMRSLDLLINAMGKCGILSFGIYLSLTRLCF